MTLRTAVRLAAFAAVGGVVALGGYAGLGGGAWATGTFPPAGTDEFPSTLTADLEIDSDGNGALDLMIPDVFLTGPTEVQRSDPGDGIDTDSDGSIEAEHLPLPPATPAPEPDGLREVDTEITSMVLTGNLPGIGPIMIKEDPGKKSKGAIEQQSPPPAPDFPAESFFDVFAVLEGTPYGPLRNDAPARMTAVINDIPPTGAQYRGLGPTDFKDQYGVVRVRVTHVAHKVLPSVGGIVGLLDARAPRSDGGAPFGGTPLVPIAAALAVAGAALAVAGWFTRRWRRGRWTE